MEKYHTTDWTKKARGAEKRIRQIFTKPQKRENKLYRAFDPEERTKYIKETAYSKDILVDKMDSTVSSWMSILI